MLCILIQTGTVRAVSRVTSAEGCPGASTLPTGSPSNGTVLVLEPSDMTMNPFWLTADQGVIVAGAVAGVWIVAWCWKAFLRVLNAGDA